METATPITDSSAPNIPPVINDRKHFLAAFFLSLAWGVFGADRFYLGKWATAILKLLTFGGFGIWAAIDLALIMSGSARDAKGQTLLEYERYKKLAIRIVAIFSAVVIIIAVMGGVAAFLLVQYILTNILELGPQGYPTVPEFTLPGSSQT